jgi:hypothetical protein
MAVRANVGIPLGMVTDLQRLPLLSDEGKALGKHQEKCQHIAHYFCVRHLLESLGSGTFVALLARRLLFTQTRQAFDKIIEQTLSDFAIGR